MGQRIWLFSKEDISIKKHMKRYSTHIPSGKLKPKQIYLAKIYNTDSSECQQGATGTHLAGGNTK